MGLPKIKHPTFKVKIPSTDQKVTLRPFTVREEKILLMAQTSNETDDLITAIKQVLTNCILTPESEFSVDISKLAPFDIEYLFLKLRAKSVGEIIEVVFSEKSESGEKSEGDDNDDGIVKYTAEINLDEVEIVFPEGHTKQIKFTEDIGITMRYPTFDQITQMEKEEENVDGIFKMFLNSIETVYDENGVYLPSDDFTPAELEEFILSLSTDATEKITNFFETMPSLEHVVIAKDKDGNEKEYTIKGLADFFIL